ncbi:hypothetical protein Tco_1037149 [Tanacetum coccineum]
MFLNPTLLIMGFKALSNIPVEAFKTDLEESSPEATDERSKPQYVDLAKSLPSPLPPAAIIEPTKDDNTELEQVWSLQAEYLQRREKRDKRRLRVMENLNCLVIEHLCLQLMMKDLLQIDKDAMEEIDIRWQVAMITARIRKFMRKTGRPIDLKPKNGITFDKSLTELEEDEWSMRLMQNLCSCLTNVTWWILTGATMLIDTPLPSLDGYETQSDKYEQMEYDLKLRDLKLEEKQKELDQVLKERDDFKVKLEKWTNAAVLQNEVLNKQRYLSDKSCIGFGVESSSSKESDNSSGNTNSTESLYPNFQKAKGFHAVPPPTGTIIPPRANVSFTGIDELAIRNKVVNQENTKSSQPEIDRNKVIIEDWVDSDDEETALNFSEIQKKTVLNSENSETSFENRSPNSQNSVGQGSRKKGLGHKGGKTCFVCYSPDHLIKDCDLHERTFKQTQTHKPKGMQGSRDTRPVWNNIIVTSQETLDTLTKRGLLSHQQYLQGKG